MSLEQTRHLTTAIPGPRSQELAARRDQHVSAGVASIMPVYAARLDGGIIEDVDGNRLIDLASGIAVTSVGGADRRVVEGVQEQASAFTHTCFMVTPYEGYVAVAEKLAELTPGEHAKKTALFNSGSEAVENAVKIARHFTGKDAVVTFDHAYHGRTNLTMAMTAKNMPYKHGFGPFAAEIYRAPMSYPFRDGADLDGKLAARRAIDVITTQVGADNVACVVLEPIQGEGGFIVPAPGFIAELAQWCTDHGVVFVADEVQSGFARTGTWFAIEHEGVVPDLVVSAKGIAGGMPLSAVTGRAPIMDAVHPGGLGGTYGGNPLACAAALGVIETIESDGLLERAKQIEDKLLGRLRQMQEADPRIGDVRGRGAMIAAEFVDRATAEPDARLAAAVAAHAKSEGVVTLTCGTWGNVIRFLPPLTIGDALLDEALDILEAGLAQS